MTLLEDAAFWVSIATLVFASYRFSLSQAYKSKCSDFKLCCGFIEVKRNVEVEAHIDERAIEAQANAPTEDVV